MHLLVFGCVTIVIFIESSFSVSSSQRVWFELPKLDFLHFLHFEVSSIIFFAQPAECNDFQANQNISKNAFICNIF